MTDNAPRPKPEQHPVRPGQVWADNDSRSAGRTLRVDSIGSARATCTVLTDADDSVRVGSKTVGKTRQLMLNRFRPTSTGYRLITDVDGTVLGDANRDVLANTPGRGKALVRLVVDLMVAPAADQRLSDAVAQVRRQFVEHVAVPDGPFREDYAPPAELADGTPGERADGYTGPFVLDVAVTGQKVSPVTVDEDPSSARGSSVVGRGAALISAERARQVEVEGWTPDLDARLHRGELGEAAAGYLNSVLSWPLYKDSPPPTFPWTAEGAWKPTGDPVRDLTKAGALIAAQIDRLLAEQA